MQFKKVLSSKEIIQQIQIGDDSSIILLYKAYRNEFILWARRHFGSQDEDAKDVFQDVVISFYTKVKEGKLQYIEYSLKTYLFACGRNLLLNKIKKSDRFINLSGIEFTNDENLKLEEMEKTIYDKELIRKALEDLPDDAQKILKLYYFENKDLKTIAYELGYKNANVVKTKKSELMKKIAISIKKMSKNLKLLLLA